MGNFRWGIVCLATVPIKYQQIYYRINTHRDFVKCERVQKNYTKKKMRSLEKLILLILLKMKLMDGKARRIKEEVNKTK